MKTRKFELNAGYTSKSDIKANFVFDTNSDRAMYASSISGLFIANVVISDKLITGAFGFLEKFSILTHLTDSKEYYLKDISLVTLCTPLQRNDESDLKYASVLDVENLSESIELQLRDLFLEWSALTKGDEAAAIDKPLASLICQNNRFVYYIFERLERLYAFKYVAYTSGLNEPTIRVVTFRTDACKIIAHGPHGNLTHDFVFV